MGNNSIARQLSIDIITDAPNPIIEWFNELWSRMHIIETNVYHNDGGEFIYYIIIDNNKKCVFYQDNKNNKFWGNNDTYWSNIRFKFDLGYDEIQIITKVLVENALNNSSNAATNVVIPTPSFRRSIHGKCVKKALNNSVI